MKIIEIAKKIEKNGGRLYLVGGAVRDHLLGMKNHDEDYCVVGIEEKEFQELFPQAIKRGKSFGVYDLEGKEFALARKEIKTGEGHQAFKIETARNITIEEDLKRRDITINAIARDVLTGEYKDPFGGREDIKKRTIKATSKAFQEDPLRVYRVARFAATLQFEVEAQTLKMMKQIEPELKTISKERIYEELKKALKGIKPSLFFETLKQAGVLHTHFLEIEKLIGAEQPKQYHPEGDAFIHSMEVLERVANLTEKEEIRFAALVHDLGKGETPKDEYPHHYGHDKKGIIPIKNMCKRLGLPNKWEKCGITAAKEHMIGGIFHQMRASKQVDFIERVAKSPLGLERNENHCRSRWKRNSRF
mgnify:FL=1